MNRDVTISRHHEKLIEVVIFIQNNLGEDLWIDRLAEIACLLRFHFHRIFTQYYDENVHEYIKRLRLERAAFMLQHTHTPVIEVSIQNGYKTQSAFSKAFRLHYGVSPRGYRLIGLYPQVDLDGGTLQPKICRIPSQKVMFIREIGEYRHAAVTAWKKLMRKADEMGVDIESEMAIGIAHDSPHITSQRHLRYDACLTVDHDISPEGEYGLQEIEGAKVAIFRHQGPYEELGELYNRIYSEWLPNSGFQVQQRPSFCHYHQAKPEATSISNLLTDIYLPIIEGKGW